MSLSSSYLDYTYQVKGEGIANRPNTFFDEEGVYLIIDKSMKMIWIWAGAQSRLFHRYMASNWAGKLKSRKKYYEYKYEVVKQGREPREFLYIFNEIVEGRTDLSYPGESRTLEIESMKYSARKGEISAKLTKTKKSHIKKILSEIEEMTMHIRYSLEHIGKRIRQIEDMIN